MLKYLYEKFGGEINYSLNLPNDGPLFEEDGIGAVTWNGAHVSKSERVKLLKFKLLSAVAKEKEEY